MTSKQVFEIRSKQAIGRASCWGLAIFAAVVLLVAPGQASAQSAAQPAAPPAAQSGAQESSTPKLAGTWQLNKDQSDDPRQKMQEARGDAGEGNAGGGGGGYGGGGGRGHGGRNGGGRGQGGRMLDDLQTLQIAQTGSNVKVTSKSGRVLAQYPASAADADNNAAGAHEGEREGEGERQRTTTTQWQDGSLVVQTQSPRGKSTRTYSLSPDGKQLFVSTKMENDRFKEPVTYRLVYDPASAGANAAAAASQQ